MNRHSRHAERALKKERAKSNSRLRRALVWSWTLLVVLASASVSASAQSVDRTKLYSTSERNLAGQYPFGDLVAIGAISLLESTNGQQSGGKLVDRIATAHPTTEPGAPTNNRTKLDYIIDFMRANKLTKFCDLLTNQHPQLRELTAKINSLARFTLFVPTNEALLLMQANQLEQILLQPDETRSFLMAHVTGELVVPRLAEASRWPPESSTNVIQSLAGDPLRVTTVLNASNMSRGAPEQDATNRASRLELIVNGAQVLPGHSYALQEPHNSSATYAIVHLVDRSLYPPPTNTLRGRIRALSPRMADYLELAGDSQLLQAIESASSLNTLFVPNDDAFRLTPAYLIRQLDTNRTFLSHFLRSHLVEGLHYGVQLARPKGTGESSKLKLLSMAGSELEFESKTLQARSLTMVNSIPILESDLIALNGVAHVIARPIFEQHLLNDCQCNQTTTNQSRSTAESHQVPTDLVEAQNNQTTTSFNWFQDRPEVPMVTGNELEREENKQSDNKLENLARSRSQRSGTLVARNNRDFYRPSAAPANLIPDVVQTGAELIKTQDQIIRPEVDRLTVAADTRHSVGPVQEMFEVERYKVLNATSRQQPRDQVSPQTNPTIWVAPQFTYDQPLVTASSNSKADKPFDSNKLLYSAIQNSLPNSLTNSSSADQLVLSTSRQQRLLKFKPEDARDPFLGERIPPPNATWPRASGPAYDVFGFNSDSGRSTKEPTSKTLAPSGPFSGCAFYDAECKRMVSKMVRLPAFRQRMTTHAPFRQLETSASNQSHQFSIGSHHLDSTFGETPETPVPSTSWSSHGGKQLSKLPNRLSPLNQPLPPWSDDEHRAGRVLATNWRPQDDIARILPAHGFSAGISREQNASSALKTMPQQSIRGRGSGQILLVPVKLIQDMSGSQPVNLSARQSIQFSKNNHNYHNPTPYSVSIATTHLPPMFSDHSLGRLTNFTLIETLAHPEDGPAPGQLEQPQAQKQLHQDHHKTLKSPVAYRKHPQEAVSVGVGDMSITSAARLHLATQASNPALHVSAGNFVRSAPLLADSGDQESADFFQNRTIAEIMDDSGLRIDGQQVTFARLKECLAEANLLSLVSQTGNSLTIFMPTDSAFERLVQQQAVVHQRERQLGRHSSSSRLLDPGRAHLLPLTARRPLDTSRGRSELSPLLESSAVGAAERLSLDCGSSQVRQLLLDHLSARLLTPKQLQTDMSLSALSGRQLMLSSVPSKKIVVVDGQPVVAATRAKNGMVYVVNKFLNITHQVPNVINLMETQANLSTFLSYLSFSSLGERLKRETGPLTVLAPTNEAFEQLSSSARQLINSDPSALMDVLRGHIVEGAQFGKLISMRNQLKTMNADQSIEAKVVKPNLYLLDNQMTPMRLVGTTGNGVVNSIDRLIVPSWLRVSMRPGLPLPESSRLPELNAKPMRFEQPPGDRAPLASGTLSNSLLDLTPASETLVTRSPFLRIAGSLSATSNPVKFRDDLSKTGSNSTKNMQLIEKLSHLMEAHKFLNYLFKSRVSESLKPDMNYVILVPTDQAVSRLPKQIIDLLERDPERLADLVNYHVLDTTFDYINSIPDGQTLSTLNEKDILFNWHKNNTILTVSGAIVLGGVQEENIAVLVVDRVLYPTPGDLLSIISKSPILSNFTSLIRSAGLEQQLSSSGPYTLFAPSDAAFNQLDRRDLEFLERNKDTVRRFLLRHLSQPVVFTSSISLNNSTSQIGGSARSSKLVPSMTISNSLGEDLVLRQRNDYFSVNEVNFSYADVAATNGVVHVIDGLL